MTMRASIIIEASDRASAIFARLAARARGVERGIDDIGDEAKDTDRELDRMGKRGARSMERLGRAAHRVGVGIGRAARAAASFAATGALAAGAAAGGFFAQVIEITSQFEQFQVILENTEGSAEKARQSMAWVQDFAKETPFELAQVMEAYVALRSYGIDPTNGSLRTLGDTAAGMGVDVMQAVEAMADAMTGEFERLKQFGVRAEVAGDRVTFRYRKNGQDIARTARTTGSEIESALSGILNERFGGMMVRQAGTLLGIWRNIKDAGAAFMLRIGQAGAFDRIKARAEAFLTLLNDAEGNPRVQAFVERLSDNMGDLADRAFDFAERTDWESVAKGIGGIVGATITLVEWIGKAVSAWSRLGDLIERASINTELSLPGLSSEQYRAAQARLDALDRRVYGGERVQLTPRPEGHVPGTPYPGAPRRRAPAAPYSRAPADRLRPPGQPLLGGARAPASRAPISRPQAVRVGGRMEMRVALSSDLQGRLTRLETNNRDVPIVASRGSVSTS